MHSLFSGMFGLALPMRAHAPERARTIDRELDADLEDSGGLAKIERFASDLKRQPKVQVLVPVDTTRPHDIRQLLSCLSSSNLTVEISTDPEVGCSRSRKINRLAAALHSDTDWLLVIDDDVAIEPGFLDRFIGACEAAELVLAQPAHRIHSFASFELTQRKPRSLVRRTKFVETGPVLAIQRSVFSDLLPMPETRWGWGPDFLWANMALRLGWKIGIVDRTVIEHLRPVGTVYWEEAAEEASQLLDRFGVGSISRVEMLSPGTTVLE